VSDGKVIALTATSERPVATASGYVMLIVLLLAVLADVFAITTLPNGPGGILNVAILILSTIIFILVMPGFYMLQPNQAAAITLFGSYSGTDRTTETKCPKLCASSTLVINSDVVPTSANRSVATRIDKSSPSRIETGVAPTRSRPIS